MSRGGHVLYLVMMVLAASVALGVAFASRHTLVLNGHRDDAVRTQALWLVRSGCALTQIPREVKTPAGDAVLSREGPRLQVRLAGSLATADCSTREERFSPAPR